MKKKTYNLKMKIHQGDMVRVLSGKDRGKKAIVMNIISKDNKVLVEGVNMVKKHVRPKKAGEKGQRVSVAAPINVSNVQLICPSCKKGTRIAIKREDKDVNRVCKKCEAIIPNKKKD